VVYVLVGKVREVVWRVHDVVRGPGG
jgi:hypothetical protein